MAVRIRPCGPDALTTPIGFLDGAAGIGAMLLQMHGAENGNFKAMRAIDDPFPANMKNAKVYKNRL